MAIFQYNALSAAGASIKGNVTATNRDEAYRRITSKGLKPTRVKERRESNRGKKIVLKDISHLTHQLAVLMEARIPIVEALHSIAEQESNPRLRTVLNAIGQSVQDGQSITEALEPYRDIFGEVYIETVHAAEKSGNTVEVLTNLATVIERQYEIQKKIKGAMMYPICVVIALALALSCLLILVIPKFEVMFNKRGIDLPMPTQVIIAMSHVIRGYWFVFVGAIIAVVFGIRQAWRNPVTRLTVDRCLHKVPFVGRLLRASAIGRFASILGMSLRSGLNLIESLEMAGRASGRPLLQSETKTLCEAVGRGERLAHAMENATYISGFAVRMIAAGEEAGELPRMCQIISRNYERDVDDLTKNIATIIEPIMTIGLAAIVMIVALAVFLPMWEMAAVMRK